jgi:hypothetical protein
MKDRIKNFLVKRKGQSLVEMLMAISLITIALFSVLTLLSRSFVLNRIATNQTIGTYLAAEGIEITKNIIDQDVYNAAGNNWGTCCTAGDYTADYTSSALKRLSGNNSPSLFFDSKSYLYGYTFPAADKAVTTTFTRTIHISVPTTTEIDVQSIVTWSSGGFTNQTITLEDHFYDWRQ